VEWSSATLTSEARKGGTEKVIISSEEAIANNCRYRLSPGQVIGRKTQSDRGSSRVKKREEKGQDGLLWLERYVSREAERGRRGWIYKEGKAGGCFKTSKRRDGAYASSVVPIKIAWGSSSSS